MVKVGAPCECGWYEGEGYKDPDNFLIVDEEVMVSKEEVFKVLDEAKQEFYLAIEHLKNRGVESPYLEAVIEKWFGQDEH